MEISASRRQSQSRLSQQSSFFHNDADRVRSGSPERILDNRSQQDLIVTAATKKTWADLVNEIPQNPCILPLFLDNHGASNRISGITDDTILLEGQLKKAGNSEKEDGLRNRYFYLTRKYIIYHVKANGPARGRVYFEDIVGMVSRDESIFRPQPNLEWEKDRAKQHDLRQTDFVLVTSRIGFERGRQYLIRAPNKAERQLWAICINDILDMYKDRPVVAVSTFLFVRRRVRWFYFGDYCQIFVACLIMLNFGLNIVEAQFTLLPSTDPTSILFSNLDTVFTVLFTVELMINMFSTLVHAFFADPWNYFDFTVVAISLLSLGMTNMPAAGPMRLLRCFRVFRLFKRIKALRQLIVALICSIPPMLNAFALVCLITSIYSLMAATFFSRVKPDEFGDFFSSVFTMFQVMTADAWSDLARDMFVSTGSPAAVAAFFVSFQVISSLVLLNVVIAVLLDEFHKAAEQNQRAPNAGGGRERESALDRIAASLAGYRDRRDLDSRIAALFRYVVDGGMPGYTGRHPLAQLLGPEELSLGFQRLGFLPPINFTDKDWREMVLEPGLARETAGGGAARLALDGFGRLVRRGVWRRTLRQLHETAESERRSWDSDSVAVAFQALKEVLIDESLADADTPAPIPGLFTLPEDDPCALTQLRVLLAGLDEAARRVEALERLLPAAGQPPAPDYPPHRAGYSCGNGSAGNGNGGAVNGHGAVVNGSPLCSNGKSPSCSSLAGTERAADLRRRLAERLNGNAELAAFAARRRPSEDGPVVGGGDSDSGQASLGAGSVVRVGRARAIRSGLPERSLDFVIAHAGAGEWRRLEAPSPSAASATRPSPTSENGVLLEALASRSSNKSPMAAARAAASRLTASQVTEVALSQATEVGSQL